MSFWLHRWQLLDICLCTFVQVSPKCLKCHVSYMCLTLRQLCTKVKIGASNMLHCNKVVGRLNICHRHFSEHVLMWPVWNKSLFWFVLCAKLFAFWGFATKVHPGHVDTCCLFCLFLSRGYATESAPLDILRFFLFLSSAMQPHV